MVKKYFVKWLPVEEDIKVGDMALKPAIPHIGIDEPYVESFDEDEITKLNNKDLVGHKFLKGSKKVKLFLCSKDVKPGDWYKISDVSGNTYEYFCVRREDDRVYYGHPKENWEDSITSDDINQCIKVLGEISPEAEWIQDGDEFNEEDVQYSPLKGGTVSSYKIKCPHCNKFS